MGTLAAYGAVGFAIVSLIGIVLLCGFVLLIAALFRRKPSKPAAPAAPPAATHVRGLHWMEELEREGMFKAAGKISDRYANAKADSFAATFAASVQAPAPTPPPVIQTQYPWNITNPHPVAQASTQGTSMPTNPFPAQPAGNGGLFDPK